MIREIFIKDLSLWVCVWQSTLFAVIGLVGSFIFRHRPARAFQVLFLTMTAAVLLPAMSVMVKHFDLGMFIEGPSRTIQETTENSIKPDYTTSVKKLSSEIQQEVQTGGVELTLQEDSSRQMKISWRVIMFYGWMMTTLVLSLRLFVGFIRGIFLLRRAKANHCEQIRLAADSARERFGITKDLRVRSSSDVHSPVIWCWSASSILLVPEDLTRDIEWVGVICHELAHCRRKDHISSLIVELVLCILPWNPLLWWSKKQMVKFSEHACDDWVLAGGQSCEDYAQTLLNFRPQKQVTFVPAVVSSKKTLSGRVRRILGESSSNPRIGRVWALTTSLIVLCLSIGIAFAQTRSLKQAGTIKTKVGRLAVIEEPAFAATKIRGQILYSDDTPAYFANVIALPVTSYGGRADREGYFEIPWSPLWLDEGQPICLIAKSGNYTPRGGIRKEEAVIVEVVNNMQNNIIRLEKSASLKSKVIDPNGQRITKYRAILSLPREFKCQAPIFETIVGYPREQIFSPVPYGTQYMLTIEAEGYRTKQVMADATGSSKEIIDIGTITLQPQESDTLVSKEESNPGLAEEFQNIYRLDEGEVIKLIKPPFVLGRQEYLQNTLNMAFALQEGSWQCVYHWDGKLKVNSATSGQQRLDYILHWIVQIPNYDFNLPRELNVHLKKADWIVRTGSLMAEKIKALEEILQAELNRPIHFEKREIEREVIVVTGRFEFKPLRSENPDWLYLYLDDNDSLGGHIVSIQPASINELLSLIADVDGIDIKIEDRTLPIENPKIKCRCSTSLVVEMSKAKEKKLPILLDNLSKQTGLKFKIERQPAEIWFVTEAE